jgi:hypothetical protein
MERALIIRKEWLDKIFNHGKTWEMRSRPTNITGRIGLIEAGTGMIVGEAIIKGNGPEIKDMHVAGVTQKFHQVEDWDLLRKWRFPWLLENVKKYETPITYEHPAGAVTWVKLK